MSQKALFACIVTLGLLAPAGPVLAQTTRPAPEAPSLRPATAPTPPDPRPSARAAPEAGSRPTSSEATNEPPPPGRGFFENPQSLLLVMVGVIILMVVLSSRTRRKQERKRTEMISGMKKGDRVTTIGGIIGTLIEVRENDVVVKVDEQNNVRLRFLRSAIHHVGEVPASKDQAPKS